MIDSQKNVLMSWDDVHRVAIFDSIVEDVWTHDNFIATGLVIGAEYYVTAERDSDSADYVLEKLVRADDDPLLGKESEKHRG